MTLARIFHSTTSCSVHFTSHLSSTSTHLRCRVLLQHTCVTTDFSLSLHHHVAGRGGHRSGQPFLIQSCWQTNCPQKQLPTTQIYALIAALPPLCENPHLWGAIPVTRGEIRQKRRKCEWGKVAILACLIIISHFLNILQTYGHL